VVLARVGRPGVRLAVERLDAVDEIELAPDLDDVD
jgi:hypothetical protein